MIRFLNRFRYFWLFAIAFILTFILTFPTEEIVIYFLEKNKIKYSDVKGNFFHIEIKDIKYRSLKINKLEINNYLIKINFILKKDNYISLNSITRNVYFYFKDLRLKDFQEKTEIDGVLTAEGNLFIDGDLVKIDGKGNIKNFEITKFGFDQINIEWKSKGVKDGNYIDAKITGSMINGNFKGLVKVKLNDAVYIEGKFEGKFEDEPIATEIKEKFNLK